MGCKIHKLISQMIILPLSLGSRDFYDWFQVYNRQVLQLLNVLDISRFYYQVTSLMYILSFIQKD
jgi:hypothetical protein